MSPESGALRLFTAVDVPAATKDAVVRWADGFRRRDDGWRWVRPEAVHLTLRFYGSTPPSKVAEIESSLAAIARIHPPHVLGVAGWGVFPGPGRPRVLWAGLAGDTAPLARLAAEVEAAARAAGFEPEERAFKPHLTVARAQERARPRLPAAPDRANPVFGELPVTALVLYRSHLGPGGSRYEALVRFPLGGGAPDA